MSAFMQLNLINTDTVENNGNVLFDSTVSLAGDISYDSLTGVITLLEAGIYEFTWWVATQTSFSPIGAGFALVSSQGDNIMGNSPIKTGEVVGVGIIEVTSAPVTVELKNNSNATMVYSSTVPVKASLAVLAKDDIQINGSIIPFSSGTVSTLTTNADGTPDLIEMISFGSNSGGSFTGGQIDASFGNMSFVVPRDGIINAISGFYNTRVALDLGEAVVAITLQLYSAGPSDIFFSPVSGTELTLAPLFTGNVPVGINIWADSPELSIPVTRGTRLLLVYSASITEGPASQVLIVGYACAGLTIL